jgi:hypothetical protein
MPATEASPLKVGLIDTENAEGEELAVPLPWLTKGELTSVRVYGELLSPPSAKVRALLAFYGLPFAAAGIRKPGSVYTKRPIVDVAGVGGSRQINDSVVIFRNLAPILTGIPLEPRAVAADAELAGDWMASLEATAFLGGTHAELARFACQDHNLPGFVLWLAAPFFIRGIGRSVAARHPDLQPFGHYLTAFKAKFAGAPYFHGATPGPVDVAAFGLLYPFLAAGVEAVRAPVAAAGLADWNAGVLAAFPAGGIAAMCAHTPR